MCILASKEFWRLDKFGDNVVREKCITGRG